MNCFKPYDVFVSHAAEDGILADEITQSLRQSGLRVWYSSDHLPVGESIAGNVEKGIKQCRYGVVILSPFSLESSWLFHEVHTMMAARDKNQIVIIPIRHNVASVQVNQVVPGIADTYSLSTLKGQDNMISQLNEKIRSKRVLCAIISFVAWMVYKNRQSVLQFFTGVLLLISGVLIYWQMNASSLPENIIEQKIRYRIDSINGKVIRCALSDTVSSDRIVTWRNMFDGQPSQRNRHAFEFSNGITDFQSKVSLKRAGIPVDLANINSSYGFRHFVCCLNDSLNERKNFYLNYSFINTDSVTYEIMNTRHIGEQGYQVEVRYTNFIRAVNVSCSYQAGASMRFEKIKYTGLSNTEKLFFEQKDGIWMVTPY